MSKLKVRGIAMYAMLHAPNKINEHVYSIDLVVENEQATKLESFGLTPARQGSKSGPPKEYKDYPGKKVFAFTRSVTLGKAPIVDDNAVAMGSTIIGNGSEVILDVSIKPYDNKFGKGHKGYVNGAQVINLVSIESEPMFKPIAGAGGSSAASDDDLI